MITAPFMLSFHCLPGEPNSPGAKTRNEFFWLEREFEFPSKDENLPGR